MSTFALTLKLNTTPGDNKILDKRFYYAFLMRNRLVRHARKALSSMRQDKRYRALLSELSSLRNNTDPESENRVREIYKDLNEIRMSYGLSEYQFHAWIVPQQHRYKKHIDSNTAQKVATAVWRSVAEVLFRKGKSIRFKKLDNLHSVEGKSNASGIRYKAGKMYWKGLVIQPQIRKNDVYAREALKHKVKFCRIKRMAMGKKYHYYLQLILEGLPPKKHEFLESGRVGIDPGTSSEAVFSENGCILTELAPGTPKIEHKVRVLQRKLDRSRRANNPDHYNPDGTIKRVKKPWNKSRSYKKLHMRLKTLRRRNADYVRQSEEILANEILVDHGTDVIAEKMNYKALQARAKGVKKTKNNKIRSNKRFGKSLSKHAPARFLSTVDRKLGYLNKSITYVNTSKFKASQYDHVTEDYTPAPLNKRTKMVGNKLVQRDLYSAFLLFNAKDEETVDKNSCGKTYPLFLKHQDKCIKELIKSNQNLSSFGLKDFTA